MRRKYYLLICCFGCFACSDIRQAQQLQTQQRPDVIIIMADDLGYSDLGCYGGEIATPNLDKLAAGGVRMMSFYNNARCCPTRASLLTGQYAHKVGLANNGNALTRNAATLAELLREQGYQTGMVGKWHLSDDIQKPSKEDQLKWLNHQAFRDDDFASRESYPVNRGFQKHYGIIWGVVNYFDPFSLVEGVEPVKEVSPNYYITDAINEHTIAYVNEFSAKADPFFMYVAHTAPHWPVHAPAADVARLKNRYLAGWDELRKQRYARMVKMGLVDPQTTPLTEVMGRMAKWNTLSAEEREKQALKMATHAAMVERVDAGVGQLIDVLTRNKRLDNTIILFLADNGASPEVPSVPGYDRPSETRHGKLLQYDAALQNDLIGSELSYTGIGSNWANALNTPFRYWKMESFEGGIHTPFIVHWPAGLKLAAGSTINSLAHVTDVVPTILAATNTSYPASYNNHRLTGLDGKSMLPIWQGKTVAGRDTIYFEHARGKAMMSGNYKLVMPTNSNTWELYNITTDRNELNNIAARNPSQLQAMQQAWEAWYETMKPYIKPRPGSGPQ